MKMIQSVTHSLTAWLLAILGKEWMFCVSTNVVVYHVVWVVKIVIGWKTSKIFLKTVNNTSNK